MSQQIREVQEVIRDFLDFIDAMTDDEFDAWLDEVSK